MRPNKLHSILSSQKAWQSVAPTSKIDTVISLRALILASTLTAALAAWPSTVGAQWSEANLQNAKPLPCGPPFSSCAEEEENNQKNDDSNESKLRVEPVYRMAIVYSVQLVKWNCL